MSQACAAMVGDGVIRGVLATVECQTRVYASSGYQAFSGSPLFQTALTAVLTIYVALLGYRMLFAQGATRLTDAPGVALKIGAIVALVTSWPTFQTLVFDVAARAPQEIAAIVSTPTAGESVLAARPINGLQTAYDEFAATATAYGKLAGPNAKGYSSPQAAAGEAAAAASGLLFASSAGVISAATLALGVLTAVGPLFILLALFPVTRGVFVGWARVMVAAAVTPLVGWLLIVLMLSALEPWVEALAVQRVSQRLDPQTAMSGCALIFVFAAGQAALVLGAWITALGLRLPRPARAAQDAGPGARASASAQLAQPFTPTRAERLALDLQRDAAQASERRRMTAAAASGRPSADRHNVTVDDTRRLGAAYRRNIITARRTEAAR